MEDMLVELGLTKREANTYLQLFSFKETTATQLAKVAKEHRTNIYDTLNELIKKGLVTYVVKNNVNYYMAAEPEKLLDYVHEKERIAEKLVPQLRSKQKQVKDKPTVEVYEGKEGLKTILSIAAKQKHTLYGIGASSNWETEIPIATKQYLATRKKNNVKAKLLYVAGTKPMKFKLNEYKFLPTSFISPSTIVTFGDHVATIMWTEPIVATVTISEELANSYRKYFDVLWKSVATKN